MRQQKMKKTYFLIILLSIVSVALYGQEPVKKMDEKAREAAAQKAAAEKAAHEYFKSRDQGEANGMATTSNQLQKNEQDAVRKVYEDYKTAILNNLGADAADCVDSLTINYYSDMLEHIKYDDSIAVNSLAILDKFMVLAIRHRTPKDSLLSFNGRKMFISAVEEGMVGKNSVMNQAMGVITTNGDFAEGAFILNGRDAPFKYHFYRESGQWKLNLTSIFPFAAYAFTKLVKDSGMEENEYLLFLLEMTLGEKVSEDIWHPIFIK